MGGGPQGVAPEADLVFVHLTASRGGFALLGDSVTLLEAIDFIARTAGDRPWVINLSMGNMGGPHDGTTLVEQAIDAAVLAKPGRALCQSCGNYHERKSHTTCQIRPGQVLVLHWETDQAVITPNELEIWYSARDRFSVRLVSPLGDESPAIGLGQTGTIQAGGRTVARIYQRATDPNNHDNHFNGYLYPGFPPGRWLVEVTGEDVVDGRLHAWIERDEACLGCQSHFRAEEAVASSTTGTICNGLRTIAVGAYDAHAPELALAPFSSMGPTRDGRQKPDLCAPGVSVLAGKSAPSGALAGAPLLTRKSGTSMAAPHVTGCVALMFEAAPRPLHIEETRRLLLGSTSGTAIPSALRQRVGSGILDIKAAVESARDPAHPPEWTAAIIPSAVALPPSGFEPVPAAEIRLSIPLQTADPVTTPELEVAMNGAVEQQTLATYCHECGRPLVPDVVEDDLSATETGPLGRGRIGPMQFTVDPLPGAPAFTGNNFDEALRYALAHQGSHTVITGNLLTGKSFDVFAWNTKSSTPVPAVIEFDARQDINCLVLDGGIAAYFPSNLTATTLRWVQIPRLKEYYGLSAADQNLQRRDWVATLARAASSITVGNVTVNRAWIEQLSMPAIRLLLAQFGSATMRVLTVNDPPHQYLGGAVNGVTLPLPLLPLQEPDCYLPVISRAEGKLESINAYDLKAGISVAVIQINTQRGALFRFLGAFYDRDPDLFRQELGTPLGWSMQSHGDHNDLVITGPPQVVLHGQGSESESNSGYFQSGTKGNTNYSQINDSFRRDLAGRFRDVIVWPHVQEMTQVVAAWFLSDGLTLIQQAANNIPPLSVAKPDRNTYILKALLMSVYVRYSACLEPLLKALRMWSNVSDKLQHLEEALNGPVAWGGCHTNNRTHLIDRLKAQRPVAENVHDMITRIAGGGSLKESESIPDLADEPDDGDAEGGPFRTDDLPCGGAAELERIPGISRKDWGESLVGLADEAISAESDLSTSGVVLEAALGRLGLKRALSPLGSPRRLSAAEVFDVFQTPTHRDRDHFVRLFEVVATPRSVLGDCLLPGDVLVERALGEGRIGHMSVVATGEVFPATALAGAGFTLAGPRRGMYAQVIQSGAAPRGLDDRFARQVTGADGRLGSGQILLRLRPPSESGTKPVPAEDLPSSKLTWAGATDEQLAFMRDVYDAHVQIGKSIRSFVGDVPAADLEVVEGAARLRRPAAAACRDLLLAIRADLAQKKQAGDPKAKAVSSISVGSGYRSASEQFSIWQKNFPGYYQETRTEREKLAGGVHGPKAVAFLASKISGWLASPGFSLHNNGLAIDFLTIEGNKQLALEHKKDNVSAWKVTWFWSWMTANASTYHFFQNTSIDEPWHWEYRAPPAQ
jgi:hypothetical protein